MQYFLNNNNKHKNLCLGTWSLDGKKSKIKSYTKLSEKEIYEILEKAIQKNIHFFDTAPVYGFSEKYLGNFIKKIRDKVIIASKVGCESFNKKINFRKKNILNQIENIQKNLKSDYIDIIQLYNPDPKDKNLMSAVELLEKLKIKKKIKLIGVTLNKPEDYIELRKIYKFKFIQCNFNILDQRLLDHKVLKYIKKDKSIIYARTVLNFGLFTENFLNKNKPFFSKSDHRSKWNKNQIYIWKHYAKLIRNITNRNIETTSYRFANSFKLNGLIIGATKKEHIDEACKKKNFISLPIKDKNNIKKMYKKYKLINLKKPFYQIKL